MIRFYIFIFIVLSSYPSSSQGLSKLDSLHLTLRLAKTDSARVILYHRILGHYRYENRDSVYKYADLGIELAEKVGNHQRRGFLYYEKFLADRTVGELVQGKSNLETAEQIGQEHNDRKLLAAVYNAYASLAVAESNIADEIDYRLKSLKISEEDNDIDFLRIAYNNLGSVYSSYGKLDLAYELFEKALALNTQVNDLRRIATNHNNIAEYYEDKGQYEKSIEHFRLAMDYAHRSKAKKAIGGVTANFARVFNSTQAYDSAIHYSQKALKVLKEMNWIDFLCEAHTNIAKSYFHTGRLTLARYHVEKADSLANAHNFLGVKRDIYEVLAQVNEADGNHRSALQYHRLFVQISDSVLNEEKAKQFEFAQVEYETQKKQQQIANLELEKQNEVIKRNAYLVGLIALMCLLTFIVAWSRYRIKKNKQLKANEIQRFKSELSIYTHRLVEKSTRIEELNRELEKVRQEISGGCPAYNGALDNLMQSTILTYDEWTEFKKLFVQVHPGFFTNLRENFPGLTDTEERLFALTRLNLSTREVASMLGISVDSVNKSKYRLRKKLEITSEEFEKIAEGF